MEEIASSTERHHFASRMLGFCLVPQSWHGMLEKPAVLDLMHIRKQLVQEFAELIFCFTQAFEHWRLEVFLLYNFVELYTVCCILVIRRQWAVSPVQVNQSFRCSTAMSEVQL